MTARRRDAVSVLRPGPGRRPVLRVVRRRVVRRRAGGRAADEPVTERALRLRERPEFTDGYCTVCGQRRPEPDRDEVDVGGIVLVTDRGLHHARNEDAAAAGIVPTGAGDGRFAFAVAVCDGVSTSVDAQTAATAAARAGVVAMLDALAACRSGHSAATAGLASAAQAAARTAAGKSRSGVGPGVHLHRGGGGARVSGHRAHHRRQRR